MKKTNPYSLLVKPYIVKAVVKDDYMLKRSWDSKLESGSKVYSGDIVTVLQDRSYKWYKIRIKNGRVGWIPAEYLSISPNKPTNREKLSTDEIEGFVNYKGLNSKTDYLVWVDIDRQMTYVLKKKEGMWKLEKEIICSTGKNISPTKRGKFVIKDRGEWFYSERLQSGAMYWVRYSGSYLFHSVAMDKNRNITDDTLGRKSSAGCVRMSIEDSKWFYENIPKGTLVFVN